jgi:hypothetical protein
MEKVKRLDPASEAAADAEIHRLVKEKQAAGVSDYGQALLAVKREYPGLWGWKLHLMRQPGISLRVISW